MTAYTSGYACLPRGQAESARGPPKPVSTKGLESPEQDVDEAGSHVTHTEF